MRSPRHLVARMTKIPEAILRDAIKRLLSPIKWLENIPDPPVDESVTEIPQEDATSSHEDASRVRASEWKGMEGNGTEGNGTGCSEPAAPASEPAFPWFHCVKGRKNHSDRWLLTDTYVEELQRTFEGVDVTAECRKAWLWNKTHRSKRKTANGMPEFLLRWVTRAQNESGRQGERASNSDPRRTMATASAYLESRGVE
jgi:hypothetical protein